MIWLANQTHPNIANAVRAVARYTNSPRKVHWKTAVGIFVHHRDFDMNIPTAKKSL